MQFNVPIWKQKNVNRERRLMKKNRDGVKQSFSLKEDTRLVVYNILKARGILRNGFHQFLNKFGEEDLGFY